MNWKLRGKKYSWHNLRYFLQGLRKTTEIFDQDSQFPFRILTEPHQNTNQQQQYLGEHDVTGSILEQHMEPAQFDIRNSSLQDKLCQFYLKCMACTTEFHNITHIV